MHNKRVRMIRLKMKMFEILLLPLVFATKVQDFNYNNLSDFTLSATNQDNHESKEFFRNKCVIKLIQESINELGSTFMFLADGEKHENLVHNLQINFVHSYFTEPEYLAYSRPDSFYNLLIFGNKITLQEVLEKKKPTQDTKFFIHVRNYDEVIEKFQILWKNRLINAVATYMENSTVYYYTYFPYCSRHCGRVGAPYLLTECDVSNGVFSRKTKLYPTKVYDLHKCPVKITLTQKIPASYYTAEKKFTGWEVDLLNEILKRMNGVPHYKMLRSSNGVYRTTKGYSRLVKKSEIGAGMAVSLKSLVKTDFCMYGMSLCATWIVPKKEDISFSASFLVKVFPPDTWILLFLTYFVMAITFKLFFKIKYCNILFKLLPFLLGNTTRTKRTSKRLAVLWLWFCLTMNAIYQSGFQSTLLVPDFPKQLSTTEDVVQSNLKILGVLDLITDAFPYLKYRYNLSSRRFRRRKFTYEDWVYRMTIKKDSAYLGFKETVQYHTEHTKLANKLYISEHCVIKYLVAFVLKRNSHLTNTVVKFANRLNENGFLIFFITKHFSRKSKQKIPPPLRKIIKVLEDDKCSGIPPPITMNKILVVFVCLSGGLSLGLIAFIWELLFQKYQNKFKTTILRKIQLARTKRN